MPRVMFTPSGLEVSVDAGTTVLDAARRVGVDLDSVCGGRGICGRCQVVPGVGSFAKWGINATPASITPLSTTEQNYRGRRPLAEGRRLGCATQITADTVVDVPPDSQVHRQVVRKTIDLSDLVIDPVVSLAYITIDAPMLGGDEPTTCEAVRRALSIQHNCTTTTINNRVLRHLAPAFANGERAATVALRHSAGPDEAIGVWPGFVDAAYGVAIDIGSTTIAGHLCDLATGEVLASSGRMNPQIRFGEDLMSRVSYVMMNPGGDHELTAAVRTALDELVRELTTAAATELDRVVDVVLVGNPIMHHLVLGIDPTPLGTAPFTLATADAVACPATELGMGLPFADVYLLPCIAGHVGADTAAVILSEQPHHSNHTQLVVDVGTNAEIVLGSAKQLYAASSPTGPAFEGAQISCGQRATAGAIERVRIDRVTLEPRVKVIGCELWSDDPGFVAATAGLNISGVCGSGIIEALGELFLCGVILHDGTIDTGLVSRATRVIADGRTASYVLFEHGDTRLLITQNDVRAIQLAKAALRAGIDLLVVHAGVSELTDIRLAGAFGAHIDPLYAMVLGLVPDAPLTAVRSVGNAAGAGAVRALLSRALRAEIEDAVRAIAKIETATEPMFQELFVAAMAFPHASAANTNLAAVVDLPARRVDDPSGGAAPRRRRRL